MRNRGFYNRQRQRRRGRGNMRGGRGRGPGAAFGPWAEWEDAPPGAWRRGWGWRAMTPDAPQNADDFFGPPPWAAGRWQWDADASDDVERRAWLQARKSRLQAWKQHLDARLAETEAELSQLD